MREVVDYHRAHPDEQHLLSGMNTVQFFTGIADLPFELYSISQVHLAPGGDRAVGDSGRLAPLFLLPPEQARRLSIQPTARFRTVHPSRRLESRFAILKTISMPVETAKEAAEKHLSGGDYNRKQIPHAAEGASQYV